MPYPIYLVDAFAKGPFHGNPAAVCLFADRESDDWRQSLAGEMNQAETAFVTRNGDDYGIRWFTPTTEVDLCGHATVAAIHALHEHGLVEEGQKISFSSRSGNLPTWLAEGLYWLDFPQTPPIRCPEEPENLLEALGLNDYVWIGRSKFDLFVEVEHIATLKALAPDFYHLSTVVARGVIVTAKEADSGYDFVSRFFAPQSGIDEDPVTGSAHCALGPYWSEKLGKSELRAYQMSDRGGEVAIKLTGDRAHLGGPAITVIKGELF